MTCICLVMLQKEENEFYYPPLGHFLNQKVLKLMVVSEYQTS